MRRTIALCALVVATCSAYSCPGGVTRRSQPVVRGSRRAFAVATESEEVSSSQSTEEPELPAWLQDDAPVAEGAAAGPSLTVPEEAPLSDPEDLMAPLSDADLDNTKWAVTTTNRAEGWLGDGGQTQEFTLLDDGSVVWGGEAGGFGTGGRWQLRDDTLEVIRTTPLGLITGRDYYMSVARAEVTDGLQFKLTGIIRSYNALYPVAVVADFVAVRQPGRFVRNTEEEE
mmetsp:Transcript_24813/g.42372  ORF Transcript_24813/g.42372 Transcript_24813/m.42372 type:complete len:228 (+) Transcript_24813:27-710(+)